MAVDISSHVPILVGVVGCEDNSDGARAAVATEFSTILRDLRATHPETPVLVLCALTAPVELVALRTAIELGIPVVVCRRDDPPTIVEMLPEDQVAPIATLAPDLWSVRNVSGDPRMHIMYFSDILLATPSAETSREIGEIADARRKREHDHGLQRLLAPGDVGPCYFIELAGVRKYFPPRFTGDDRSEKDFIASLQRRERFNHDIRETPEPTAGTPIARLRTRTAVETARLQRRTRGWQIALYLLAVIAALSQIATPLGHNETLLFVKFAAVVLGFAGWFFFIHLPDRQNRYQDYRAISEALRVQVAWSAIGITGGVDDSYLPMQQTELQWIRNVIRTVRFFDDQEAAPNPVEVVTAWIAMQQEYFRTASGAEAGRRVWLSRAALACGGVSVLASVATLGMLAGVVSHTLVGFDLSILAGAGALMFAILQSYSRTRGYSENANRYQRMYFIFTKALELVKADAHHDAIRHIAVELGRDALAEHADWLLSQRQRPIATIHAVVG